MASLRYTVPFILLCILYGCKPAQATKEIKIAFMADVHFADVYPDSKELDGGFLPENGNGNAILLRSMQGQLHSTRLFNENYFAFTAALDDAVGRGIKLIAMPGDFSDDGQPLHIKGLKKVMNRYVENYGLSFFVINGNHDPTRPFGRPGGEVDFLGKNGKAQPILSEIELYSSDLQKKNPTLVFKDIEEWGYEGIVQELREFGFFPNEDYIFWETPFSSYIYEDYTLKLAEKASQLSNRTYNFDKNGVTIPDVSYVVEPVEGLWLLALDANVYVPKQNGVDFEGAGIGYNEVLKHKQYLIDWTEEVIKEANRLGKTVIAFSHYPMIEFNDGASEEMKALFGDTSFQAHRIPNELVGTTFADIGLKVHVGGHMHLNDTGMLTTENGNTLTNIQTPSLAAYAPGYKIITVREDGNLNVETIAMDSVSGFDTFFELYKKEHDFLAANFSENGWDKEILRTKKYSEFTNVHLKELVRLRFLNDDWPTALKDQLIDRTGWELLKLAAHQMEKAVEQSNEMILEENLLTMVKEKDFSKADFDQWSGLDLIIDFYRFRNGDQLALKDIDPMRLKAYKYLFNVLSKNTQNESLNELRKFAEIFQKQMNGESAVKFIVEY